MLRYALKRLLSLALSLLVASLVIFLTLQVVPGDPASYMLGLNASPEAVAALRAELGLDAGPAARYLAWVGGMLTGDFGISYTYRTPVADMVRDRLQVSLPLALYALLLSTVIAFPVGIWAAARRSTTTASSSRAPDVASTRRSRAARARRRVGSSTVMSRVASTRRERARRLHLFPKISRNSATIAT